MSTTERVNENLARLTAAGVSIWLDQIRRSLVEGGELARMIEEESLLGRICDEPKLDEHGRDLRFVRNGKMTRAKFGLS